MEKHSFRSALYFMVFILFALSPTKLNIAQSEIWGISGSGGDFNEGAIFKTDANGEYPSIVYSFKASLGNNPRYTNLCEAPNGKLYGMTYNDGAEEGIMRGLIFEFDPLTNDYQVKYRFQNPWAVYSWGSHPSGSLVLANDGNLYGMTSMGGAQNQGVIFQYTPSSSLIIKLFDFDGDNSGGYPLGSLIQANDGNLYGMTSAGGLYGKGTIFEFDINSWPSITKVFDFDGINSGSSPKGDLLEASNGLLYGMTWSGGAFDSGVLFEFDPSSSVFTKKMDFSSSSDMGYAPAGSLVQASNGRLYGCTSAGGLFGKGVLFEYRPITSTYVKRFDFDSISGSYPFGNVVEADNGTLYGMTSAGGAYDMGVIYSYVPGEYMAQAIMSFNGAEKGAHPNGSMMMDSDGKLYGLTMEGGIGDGVIFQYDYTIPSFTKLLDFVGNEHLMGIHPYGKSWMDEDGKIYGTSSTSLFEYDPQTENIVKRFDFDDNSFEVAKMDDVIQTNDGKIYFVTTYNSGNGAYHSGNGAMFSLDLQSGTVDSLYGFNDSIEGRNPNTIVQGGDGMIYGCAYEGGLFNKGVVFSYDLNSSSYTKLIDFDGDTMGAFPYDLIQASDGSLYGIANGGRFGKYGYGVFFKVNTESGAYTRLVDFDVNTTGLWPYFLMKASNERLYWTSDGSAGDWKGFLLEYDPFSSNLYRRAIFNNDSSGEVPHGFIQAANGKLYGSCSEGGENGNGVLWEYDPLSFQLVKKFDYGDSINSVNLAGSASTPSLVDFHLKVYLEGPFYGSGMTPAPESVLPLEQPFNKEPWNYFGNESTPSIPINVVDWVLVELRQANSATQATPLSVIDRKPGFLLTNGRIKGLDWISDLHFNLLDNQNVYLVVYERNHVPLMSSTALNGSGGTIFYNFTTADSQAYGVNAEKELTAGIFGMYGGDANGDGVIDMQDVSENWSEDAGNWGNLSSDINVDGQANNKDKDDVMLLNQGEMSQVPRDIDCGFILIDSRNGFSYPTVKLGSQCWMAANLDIGSASDVSANQTDNDIIEQYCNDGCMTLYGATPNGGLYQWDEMMQYDTIEGSQGICPDGWHIPSDAEWCILEQSLDSTVDCAVVGWTGTDVGIQMSMTGGSGFDAFMNGFRQSSAPFFANQDSSAYFWSSTQHNAAKAWYHDLAISQSGIHRGKIYSKHYGLSVRCVKDE